MELIGIANILKDFLVMIGIIPIFCRIRKLTISNNKIAIALSIVIIISIVNYFFGGLLSEVELFILINLIYSLALRIIISDTRSNYILAYSMAVIISYILYLVSLIICGCFGYICNYERDNIFMLILIIIVYAILCYIFVRHKRFKKGFNFLENITKDTTIIILLFYGIILIIWGVIPKEISSTLELKLLLGSFLVIISLFTIIRRKITDYYRNNMKDRTIKVQQEEIEENKNILDKVKKENLKLSKTIHKYNHKLSSIELSLRKLLDRADVEFAKEIGITLSEITEANIQLAQDTKVNIALPKTGVFSIDNMLELMGNEALKSNIHFNLKIKDDLEKVLGEVISQDKFETLLADHIKDSIIAINHGEEQYKSILVIMGMSHGAYELSIYDTGIEFEVDTLVKLGLEQITTHKDSGGSGLGFMTTFDTMAISKASLIIEEYTPTTTDYTKNVTIRFDGKNEFRIYSYRFKEIKSKLNGRKIIIKEIT